MHENNQLHAHSALSRIRNYLGSHSLRYFAGAIAVILAVVTMMLPSAYTVEGPGPTQDVLGSSSGSDVISISGAETHKDSGKLLLVTVNAAGVPGYPVTNAQALVAWLDPKQTVMPQEVVFPVGQTSEEYAEESSQEMDSSQSSATNAALSYLKGKGMDVSGVKVSMHVDDIGGPSAGMMYARWASSTSSPKPMRPAARPSLAPARSTRRARSGPSAAFDSRCWAPCVTARHGSSLPSRTAMRW